MQVLHPGMQCVCGIGTGRQSDGSKSCWETAASNQGVWIAQVSPSPVSQIQAATNDHTDALRFCPESLKGLISSVFLYSDHQHVLVVLMCVQVPGSPLCCWSPHLIGQDLWRHCSSQPRECQWRVNGSAEQWTRPRSEAFYSLPQKR